MLPRGAWSEKDSDDNAESNAIHAAAAGKQFHTSRVQASFSLAPTAGVLLQILDGTTVKWEGYVSTIEGIDIPLVIKGTIGNSMTAKLAASGASGTIGKVNLQGGEF